jgi:hypothetical protein
LPGPTVAANVLRGTIVDNVHTANVRLLFAFSKKRLYTPQSLEWESGKPASRDYAVMKAVLR